MVSDSKNNKLKSHPVRIKRVNRFYYPLSTLSRSLRKFKKSSPLLLISSSTLIVIGLLIVFAAMIGQIKSAWLAFLLCTLGSITTMLGVYIWYEMLRERDDMDDLFKESIKRVINSQN